MITETYDLGLGLAAVVEYRDAGPDRPPEAGHDWPVAGDWPWVAVTLRLPRPIHQDFHPVLGEPGQVSRELTFEETPEQSSFFLDGDPIVEFRARLRRGQTAEALACARRAIEKTVRRLRARVSAREDRLTERERRIQAAREGSVSELCE